MDGSLRRDSLPLNHIFADNITLDKREQGVGGIGKEEPVGCRKNIAWDDRSVYVGLVEFC